MLSRVMFAMVVIGVIMLGLVPSIMISEHTAVAQTTSSTTTTSAATSKTIILTQIHKLGHALIAAN